MFDVYTEVTSYMHWINETILSMGGMQSCGLTLENRPTEGKVDSLYVVHIRVAQSAEAQKRRCTKILVLDENLDPQHTLFCREISFVANYAL